MSIDDKEKNSDTSSSSSSSHGAQDEEGPAIGVRQMSLSEAEDDSIADRSIPKFIVQHFRADSTLGDDLESQRLEEKEEIQPCFTVKTVIFSIIASGVVFAAIFAIIQMRNKNDQRFGAH